MGMKSYSDARVRREPAPRLAVTDFMSRPVIPDVPSRYPGEGWDLARLAMRSTS